MKRIIYTALLVVAAQLTSMAQAILPTSWNFATTTLPTGWTFTGPATNFYYPASGNPLPAARFDNTGVALTIHFASSPGNLQYDITPNSFSGGTFSVQESVDGVTYTTVQNYTVLSAGYNTKVDALNAASRYVRFIYTNKASGGGNIGLDNVSIAAAAASPEQEINIKEGTTTLITNSTLSYSGAVGTPTPKTLIIENLGTANTLNITSAVVSGANASDFTLGTIPSTVAPLGSQNLVVTFTAAATGTRNAVLTIGNNDADENPYIINLIGYGGGFASEPATQATNLVFNNVKTYRFNASFTAATGNEGYIVLRKNGSAITGVPVDGTVYQRGDIVGDAQVVFSGNATSFAPKNIVASTQYHFAVFTYNGDGTGRNYNTATPLTGSVTTPATMQPANYYNSINTSSSTFHDDLHALVYPHTQRYYSDYTSKFINLFLSRDTVNNQRVITCVYSGENKVYTEPFDYTTYNFSREHTYCHSWMPTYPNNTDAKEYSDYHHLFPVNQNQVNGVRSNYPLGKVVTVFSEHLGSKLGQDASGKYVFEPRDEHKGDAARAMFYEAIAYNTVDGKNWKLPSYISTAIPYGQDQAILKQWSMNDLPTSWEISRNDFIDSLQGNRNPFVDHPEYVCFINFSDMTYQQFGCTAGVEEELAAGFIMYPNPAKKELFLHVDGTSISAYEIIDMQGRKIMSEKVSNVPVVELNTSSLRSGSYLVKVSTPYGDVQRALIIE